MSRLTLNMRTVLHRLPVRHRMLHVWTDPKMRSYFACLKHGIVGAELDNPKIYESKPCPICCAEVGMAIDAQQAKEDACPAS